MASYCRIMLQIVLATLDHARELGPVDLGFRGILMVNAWADIAFQ
jgi:hypothetical protein